MDDSKVWVCTPKPLRCKAQSYLGIQTHTKISSVIPIRIIFLKRALDNRILKKKKYVGYDSNAITCR